MQYFFILGFHFIFLFSFYTRENVQVWFSLYYFCHFVWMSHDIIQFFEYMVTITNKWVFVTLLQQILSVYSVCVFWLRIFISLTLLDFIKEKKSTACIPFSSHRSFNLSIPISFFICITVFANFLFKWLSIFLVIKQIFKGPLSIKIVITNFITSYPYVYIFICTGVYLYIQVCLNYWDNNKCKDNFLKISHFSIQYMYSSEFSIGWSISETPLLIWWKAASSHFC